jgi:Protein of unknown function (DUF3179)
MGETPKTRAILHPMKRILLPALWAVALLSATVVLVPVFLLKPFSPQTARAVAIAYNLREAAPIVSLVCAALVLGGATLAWRGRRIWARLALAMAVVASGGAAWLARQNHFEWMFNPLKNPAYASVAEAAAFVDPADMLIAVELRGDAVGYPVRQMAYHHVVNDQVGGVPIVSTY